MLGVFDLTKDPAPILEMDVNELENGAAIIHQIDARDYPGAGGVKSRHL
jgi:hypothetical protein